MNPNMMINPIGPVQAYTINPMQMQQPTTIKIDITPNAQPNVEVKQAEAPAAPAVEDKKVPSIYDMPKTSIYEAPKAEKVEEKQVETKKQETTAAQALAAQAVIQLAPATQAKVAEVAKIEKTEDKKVEPKRPEIVAPEKIKTGIDLNGLIAMLTSPDYNEQADTMEAISEVTMYAPERAEELLDNKVVDNLLKIMGKDTSKLQGEEKQLADRNKEYAMYTTATLQNLYANGVKDLAKTIVPADELIGMAGIVKELKTNPNASVREAAVASLGYMIKPEYKKDLAPIINEATRDKDASVKAQATKQLNKALNLNA